MRKINGSPSRKRVRKEAENRLTVTGFRNGDKLVICSDRPLSDSNRHHMLENMRNFLACPESRALILDPGLKLAQVLRRI